MKMTTLTARIRQSLSLTGVVVGGMLSTCALAAQANPVLQALFEQADYWHQRSHDDLARNALQKILMVDANNTRALYLMALYAQNGGDNAEAAKWRERLSKASPQDPLLQALDNARQAATIPPSQLALARQQARSGNISASLQTWRNLFSGSQPPAGIAAEYYLTMAGDRTLLPQAIDHLREFAAAHPQDTQAAVALGKALTYQEPTRREGVQMLSGLASGSADADQAMRQALLWLAPKIDDAPLYQLYQQRHPQDTAVMDYYRKNVGGNEKDKGFTALNSGDLSSAQTAFGQVLQANPEDADALAGMGYAAQRRGDFAAAASLLERAARQGGENSAQRRQQADDARFYAQLANAQQAMKSGDTAQALTLSEPLAQAGGDKGLTAKLFRADVLRRTNDFSQAERLYRDILQTDADNRNAKEGLYYVLREQNRADEANTLFAALPESVRRSMAPRPVTIATSAPVRNEAKQALAAGDTTRAIGLLQQGVQRFPNDGWLKLDLARIYQQQGNTAAATALMQPLFRAGASADDLYAAALFASENNAWQQASTLLSRIPPRNQNEDTRSLARRVNFNSQMATAQVYLSRGENAAAANTLRALSVTPPDNPADAGKLARSLAAAGDATAAVALVRNNMQRGVQGNAGDYADQVGVLNQAGLSDEAQSWLSRPELVSRSSAAQLDQLRTGFVVREADSLRENQQYAQAYDKLARALQRDPKNTELMFAMARLYQSGKMHKEAADVYDYLLLHDNPAQEARVGAINVALDRSDANKAHALSTGLQGEQTPERLLLLARIADAEGNRDQAFAYLRTARAKAVGLEGAMQGNTAAIGGLAVADNPFIYRASSQRSRTAGNRAPTTSTYGSVMPWQHSGTGETQQAFTDVSSQREATLNQITRMMDDIDRENGGWVQSGMQVRGRDGESGLSRLTEAKAPLTWSSGSFGDARLSFTVTPMTMNAGSASGDAYRRYGAGAGAQAVQNMVTTINGAINNGAINNVTLRNIANSLGVSPASIPDTFTLRDLANMANQVGISTTMIRDSLLDSPVNSVIDRPVNSILNTPITAVEFNDLNPLTSAGQSFLENNRAAIAALSPKPNVDTEGLGSTDSQRASGAELNFALIGKNYKLDFGSTPLGQDLNTLVGGVQWSPRLTNFLTLMVTGERRAVTDSLLSYVGRKDAFSGQNWGQVTRNGGNVLLSYDNGDVGFYGGGGAYRYLGENVQSNTGVMANAGAYVRPFHDRDRELKTGVSLSWMNFDKNLSYYSYGQGGYFSPQDYVSVSLPVEWRQQYDDLSINAKVSLGYQSYSLKRSDYFPNNPDWQAFLDEAVTDGFAKESHYAGDSKNGIGYNAQVGADYRVTKDVTVGGQMGYDTFGNYNETTARLYFRYGLGGK
ncbi:cellulose synthase subunit BcsC-related outer membrane protein [Dickeya chrysanthemi]|uniref:cellulose biosynthesis protein BcsC n=1 Tax=Dickeya chrysanthemi TaxID=556 RepID=UPI0025A093DF|nr:cellulose biosynthesis protein BcsC [Dickeya chrysanthemi]WJM87232.1 cellulose synthase subunit BcsC-related outer membrane protein [Dickeya chrysanthemi]